MAFDLGGLGLAELFGGLGAADAATAAIAPEVAGAAGADFGLGALGADLAAPAAAADLAAPAAVDVGAAGALGAADAFGGLGADAALGAVDTGLGGLGSLTGSVAGAGANAGADAIAGAVGSAAPTVTDAAAVAAPVDATISPAAALAGSPNIDAQLGATAATPVAGAANSAPASQSLGSTLGNIGSSIGGALKNPVVQMGIPLGVLGYNLLKGPPPLPGAAQQALNNANAQGMANVPLANQTAAQDLTLANNFQISPAQAASISTWTQNQQNALRQQIANQYGGNVDITQTSEWVQGNNQIQQQALAQQVQMINQLVSTAFQAMGAATTATSATDSTLLQAAQIQVSQDAAFQQAIGSALQSFGLIAAFSGKFGGANTGTNATA